MSSRAFAQSVAFAGALLGVAASGCRCTDHRSDVVVPAGVSLFDAEFPWTCSPDAAIGCSGTFAVRRATDDSGAGIEATPITGCEALGVRIDSLRAASRSIRIQALIFRADETGLYLAELLKAKHAAGVDVRVIVDAASNLDWQTQWMYFDLKRHGIEVEGYEALYLEWLTAEKLLDPLHANKRFHDKMWIVDAEEEDAVAVVGGLNLANEYFRVDPEALQRWRDQDVLLRGPVVADVTSAFDRNYAFFKGIKGKLPRVLDPDNAWKLGEALQRQIADVEVPSWPDPRLTAAVAACAEVEPAPAVHPEAVRFVQSRPRHDETYILQAYLAQIQAARRSILIANAYFIPSRQIARALQDAVARGVEVVVLTNSPESNDIAQVATMSRYGYQPLMRKDGGGVRIAEWIGPAAGEGTLHAKYALFDGREAIIGSYNLDPRSERLNSETAIAIRDEALVGAMERTFRAELQTQAREVTWADAVSYRRPRDVAKLFKLVYAMPLESWL